ncbi:hypothetical protein JYU34_009242 [Plutella xylostella]|uniref:Uncharacterized protein n=1 Tax=Plutella xylostella TaxID=51655 RepID=A0ABQ7QIZ8_PLUXY|nr:hypothetical protein JYU34_009242 [Plutella xylostella]
MCSSGERGKWERKPAVSPLPVSCGAERARACPTTPELSRPTPTDYIRKLFLLCGVSEGGTGGGGASPHGRHSCGPFYDDASSMGNAITLKGDPPIFVS